MHEVLVNRLGGLSLPRKSVVRLTDRPDMTLDVYRGRKTTMQQYPHHDMHGGQITLKNALCDAEGSHITAECTVMPRGDIITPEYIMICKQGI